MEKFQDTLMRFGMFASANKYLKSIKNAFQKIMPFTIIGAISVLWTSVLCNSKSGLGAIWPPIMELEFLNPAFKAINFCTIGCIGLWVTMLVGINIADENKQDKIFGGLLSLVALLSITNTTTKVFDSGGELIKSVSGIFADSIGSGGMFTGIIVAIVSVELFSRFIKVDKLKIKMPEQVPAGISKSFEFLIPSLIVIVVISVFGMFVYNLTGSYFNELIFKTIQQPLTAIGGSLPGIILFVLLSCIFWAVGLHGDNMISGVLSPIILSLMLENTAAVEAGLPATNIVNQAFYRTFMATGGTGMVLSATIAIFLVSRRADNRAIAKVAFIPNLFNIGEINMFGLPIVLNPTLIIPFVLSPIISICIGYFLTVIKICPVFYIQVPWTMPPFLYGFLASGGNVMGGLIQLLCIIISILIFIPFIKIYEKQQNNLEQNT